MPVCFSCSPHSRRSRARAASACSSQKTCRAISSRRMTACASATFRSRNPMSSARRSRPCGLDCCSRPTERCADGARAANPAARRAAWPISATVRPLRGSPLGTEAIHEVEQFRKPHAESPPQKRTGIVWVVFIGAMTLACGVLLMSERWTAIPAIGISESGVQQSNIEIQPGRWRSIVIHHSGSYAGTAWRDGSRTSGASTASATTS